MAGRVKHFGAYDLPGKWTVVDARNRALAKNAAKFLDKMIAEMPWPVKAFRSTAARSSWLTSKRPAQP